MRFVSYRYGGEVRAGVVLEEHVLDIHRAGRIWLRKQGITGWEAAAAFRFPTDLKALLEREDEGIADIKRLLAVAPHLMTEEEGIAYPLTQIRLAAPVLHPEKIICLGRNYRAHAEEVRMEIPEFPEIFAKFPNSLIGPEEPIVLPRVAQQVDYEAELAVIIGKRGRDIPEAEAVNFVAGYTIFNDVSARDIQFRTSQWTAGKALDTFAPMGPWLVYREACPDPHTLHIQLCLNGEVMQNASTAEMIFRVPQIVSTLSKLMTLKPGDIIATGTPAGVGFARTPPRFLRSGDIVEIAISGIGCLRNPVVAENTDEEHG